MSHTYNRATVRLLHTTQAEARKKIEKAEVALAKLPENSRSHAAQVYRDRIAINIVIIADLDYLIAEMAVGAPESD